jgi:pyridoxine/pyridoxamine 5'-phosphate oxidase
MPAGYTPPGTKRRFLAWSFAETRLRKAHNYWLCTTRPDGRPHAAPVWGLWSDGAFVFSTDPSSRKAKNLAKRAEAIVHLEGGDEVVIVEGEAEPIELTQAIDAAYHRKYGMHLIGFPAPAAIYRVRAKVVMAWREKNFSASATRWEFDSRRSVRR